MKAGIPEVAVPKTYELERVLDGDITCELLLVKIKSNYIAESDSYICLITFDRLLPEVARARR